MYPSCRTENSDTVTGFLGDMNRLSCQPQEILQKAFPVQKFLAFFSLAQNSLRDQFQRRFSNQFVALPGAAFRERLAKFASIKGGGHWGVCNSAFPQFFCPVSTNPHIQKLAISAIL